MSILNVMAMCTSCDMEVTDVFKNRIMAGMNDWIKDLQDRRSACSFTTNLLYGRHDGVFAKRHVHLRNMDVQYKNVQDLLISWNKAGRDVFLVQLEHGTIYHDPLFYENEVNH